MPDFLQLFATLREQMNAELTRTDALRPLVWPVAGIIVALSAAIRFGASKWLLIGLAGMLAVLIATYVGMFVFFAIMNPDALRSEKYQLHKMAIEQGLLGDSVTGLKRLEDMPPAQVIDAVPTKELPGG